MAQRVLVAAGLQVHFARLAALLTADDLKPVADGVCPCAAAPDDELGGRLAEAHNTRFCTCSLCSHHVERRARQVRAVQLDRGHLATGSSKANPTRSRARLATSAATT